MLFHRKYGLHISRYSTWLCNCEFAAGQTRAPFYIKIIDDIIYENSESFQLTIAEVSLPDGFIIGANGNSIVDIMDNEGNY